MIEARSKGSFTVNRLTRAPRPAVQLTKQENKMKKLLVMLAALLALYAPAAAQNTNSSASAGGVNSNAAKKRGPIFRATKDQITQAQNILKQRGFYNGVKFHLLCRVHLV